MTAVITGKSQYQLWVLEGIFRLWRNAALTLEKLGLVKAPRGLKLLLKIGTLWKRSQEFILGRRSLRFWISGKRLNPNETSNERMNACIFR